MKFQAHITDDWQRDSLVIQVRQMNDADVTTGIAEAVEDTDGVPVLRVRPLTRDESQDTVYAKPIPGLRVRWDMAVAIAQAVIAHTNAPADPGKVNDLLATLTNLQADHQVLLTDCDRLVIERDNARDHALTLERLIEAKEAHLEREARTSDHFHETIEKDRRQGDAMTTTFRPPRGQ